MSTMGKKKRQADHSMGGDSSDSNVENEGKTNAPPCPHLSKAVVFNSVKKALKEVGIPAECSDCKRGTNKLVNGHAGEDDEDEGTLYICLRCGDCRCNGRLKHAENHSKNRQSDPHDIAVNPVDWRVWCFKCNKEIPSNSTKQLLECFEFIRKTGHRLTGSGEAKLSRENSLPPIEPLHYSGSFVITPAPEVATPAPDALPRVRGLANLGNTCFFNAVLQCLAQTPFLLPVLDEMEEPGEQFRLPGGEVQIGDEKENLEPLEGTLKEWGPLTKELAVTLRELQSGRIDVFVPRSLKGRLQEKCPQFAGYNEHDSHELLRQLLDSVRDEDHARYKAAILEELKLGKPKQRAEATDQQRRAVKGYGRQAGELLLRPSQVFRGELVSTLQCQKCRHSTDHIEHFLDLSLPVVADKPVHVRRRVNSEDGDTVSKHRLKMDRKRNGRRNKFVVSNGPVTGGEEEKERKVSEASDDQSDADNEDEADNEPRPAHDVIESGYSSEKPGNGDSVCGSPNAELTQPSPTSMVVCSGQLEEDSVLVRHAGRADPHSREHVNAGPGRIANPADLKSSLDLKLEDPFGDMTRPRGLKDPKLQELTSDLLNSELEEASDPVITETMVDTQHLENSSGTIESQQMGPCCEPPKGFFDQITLVDPIESTCSSEPTNQECAPSVSETKIPQDKLVNPVHEETPKTPELKEDVGPSLETEGKNLPNLNSTENGANALESRPKNSVRKPPGHLDLTKTDLETCPRIIPLPPPPPPSIRLEGLGGKDSGISGMHDVSREAAETSPDSDICGTTRRGGCEPPADTPLDSEGQGECAGALESPPEGTERGEWASGAAGEGEEGSRVCTGSTLAPRVYTTSGDCTLITCLNQFTAQELLTGNNKVGCEACTERLHGKGGKTLYTDASKQLLILNPPAILILHLKRFQVLRFTSKKNSEEVRFPSVLDLAPFCSVKCRNTGSVRKDQTEVRYALYGVVQHSGNMHGGHYVAHVKVRPALRRDDPRWAFLPPGPSRTGFESQPGAEPAGPRADTPPDPPPGKWYYVSDSHVSDAREARVLSSEAYLLFYERIW